MKKGLLDTLADRMGCLYLADLRRMDKQDLRHEIACMEALSYSLWEWNDALEYLTEERKTGATQDEAKERLLNALA